MTVIAMPAAQNSWPQSPEKRELFALVGKISLVIFAVEAVIMLALSGWILEAHTIWEGLADSTTLTIVSSPLIYYWVARPFAKSERAARAELADRLRQQAEQADVLNTTLGRLRNLLEQNEAMTVHGHNERITIENLRLGCQVLFETVRRLCA